MDSFPFDYTEGAKSIKNSLFTDGIMERAVFISRVMDKTNVNVLLGCNTPSVSSSL